MLRIVAGLTAGLVLSAGAGLAQTSIPPMLPANPVPGVAAPTVTASAPIGDNTIICKYEHMTGSLIVTQVCRTQRAWNLMQSDAKEFMEFGFRGSHQTDENGAGS